MHLPATNTISAILYGGASDMKTAFEKITLEANRRDANSSPLTRIIAVVNSYPGKDIPLEYWVMRVCLPIS